jgi:hypothetical protein
MAPVLLVPLPQIDREIGERIDLGRQLLAAAPSSERPSGRLTRDEKRRAEVDLFFKYLRPQLIEVNEWYEYNYELLKTRFSTDEIAESYLWPHGTLGGHGDNYQAAAEFRIYIEYLISGLESIRSRLHLYVPTPEPPTAPTGAAIHIQGSVYGSPMQANSPGAHQTVSVSMNLASVQDFLRDVEQSAPALNLPITESQELAAEITTIRAQLQSPKPKQDIIREGLRSIRTILEGAGGSLTATGLLNALQHIHF